MCGMCEHVHQHAKLGLPSSEIQLQGYARTCQPQNIVHGSWLSAHVNCHHSLMTGALRTATLVNHILHSS